MLTAKGFHSLHNMVPTAGGWLEPLGPGDLHSGVITCQGTLSPPVAPEAVPSLGQGAGQQSRGGLLSCSGVMDLRAGLFLWKPAFC